MEPLYVFFVCCFLVVVGCLILKRVTIFFSCCCQTSPNSPLAVRYIDIDCILNFWVNLSFNGVEMVKRLKFWYLSETLLVYVCPLLFIHSLPFVKIYMYWSKKYSGKEVKGKKMEKVVILCLNGKQLMYLGSFLPPLTLIYLCKRLLLFSLELLSTRQIVLCCVYYPKHWVHWTWK